MYVDERGEGVMFALPRSFDEFSLVHGRLGCGATWAVVLDPYGVHVGRKVQFSYGDATGPEASALASATRTVAITACCAARSFAGVPG